MRLVTALFLLGSIAGLAATADDAWTVFVRDIEDGFAAGESWRFTAALQRERLLAAARAGLPDTPEIAGATTGLRERFEVGRQICADIASARGSARIVRLVEAQAGAERVAVLRWLGASGLEYLSLRLVREPSRDVAIADVYFHRAGQSLGDALRRSVVGLLPASLDAAKVELSEPERLARDRARELAEVRRRYAGGDYAGAMVLHSGLPRILRDDRALLLERVRCGLAGDPADATEAVTAYRKAHPEDIAADLALVAHHLSAHAAPPNARPASDAHVAETLAAIDRIEVVVGADSYLELLRGEAELTREAVPAARAHARRAAETEPSLEPAHWALLSLALRVNDHAEVAGVLSILADRFAAPVDTLTRSPEFARFASSSEGQAWVAGRRK